MLLTCTISPGQFSSEFAVGFYDHAGRSLSLFAARELVRIDQQPAREQDFPAQLEVSLIEQKDNLCLIRLPDYTLEMGGQFATVKAEQLRERQGC